jgi:5-methylcytosine-specific restriction endonuclease McrA
MSGKGVLRTTDGEILLPLSDFTERYNGIPQIEEVECPYCGELCGLHRIIEGVKYFNCQRCGTWRQKNLAAVELGRKGGIARAAVLSPARRREIAQFARHVGLAKRSSNLCDTQITKATIPPGKHTDQEWLVLIRFCDEVCVRCKARNCPLTKDHIVPVHQGGTDSIDNLQPLCRRCGLSKSSEVIDYRPDGWRQALCAGNGLKVT